MTSTTMEMDNKKRQSNIFDYFFVSGISRRSLLRVPAVGKDDENILDTAFRPSVLYRFPTNVPENSWNISIQGTLMQLCHPGGISVRMGEPENNEPVYHSFLSTRDDGFRTYGHVLTYFEAITDGTVIEKIRNSIQNADDASQKDNEKIYAQKCICLSSRHSYINTAEKLLRMLYKIFVTEKRELKGTNLPIDSYIYNLLFEMPIPSMGNSLALKWNSEKPIIVQHPSITELPFIDIHLSSLFNLVGGPANVLRVLTSAFLEHQIIFVSKDCHQLMQVAEAVTSLMFPFQWLHAYAPVLPYKLAHNFLDAPVPYIMGIPLGSSEEKLNRLSSEFDQCFVDLDKGAVDCPEDQPNFPNQIILTQQLNMFYKKHLKQIEKIDNVKDDLSEDAEIVPPVPDNEKSVQRSTSSLHRRNAHKRPSKVYEDGREINVQISDKIPTTETIDANIEVGNEIDPVEELKNLHAVSISPIKFSTPPPSPVSELKTMKADEKEIQEQIFNIKVREAIFGSLVSLFSQYDKFVIHPDVDESDLGKGWFLTRESQQNFDKASFLSDQPECHLKFLSAFLETQPFATLVDSSILSQFDNSVKDPNLRLFDDRIKQAKSMPRPEKGGKDITPQVPGLDFLHRSVSIISAGQSAKLSIEKWMKNSENALRRRYNNLNGRYPRLRLLQKPDMGIIEEDETEKEEVKSNDVFPNILCPALLQERMKDSEQKVFQSSTIDPDAEWQELQRTKKRLARQPSMSEFSPEMIAQTNWKFLEKLLKDVKGKTNKLVVRKMGQEAVALGHTESSIMGLEENTLIGSLCDLLERIWCHGLHSNQKTGKSALWSHLLRYEEDSVRIMRVPTHNVMNTVDGARLTGLGQHTQSTGRLSMTPESPLHLSPQSARKFADEVRLDRRFSQPVVVSDSQYISPIPTDIVSNIKRIRQLREVKTNVGKCRAWIRLSLEQKQLQVHLKKLLSNRPLLQTMYKRYSLLRCDDEREQFLYHLLSLNAVDFTCFTNSFTKTTIPYRVWIFPKKQLSGISQTSANVYIMISGELACTGVISVPKNCLEFSFQQQNLGVLTTMILGHDNAGMLPKWLVEYAIVRNEVSGQAYYLPCGRWLGSSIDDGSTQRLLLAHTIPHAKDLNIFIHEVSSGKNQLGVYPVVQKNLIDDLRDYVGQAVNAVVKHFHRPSQDTLCPGALTPLLCKPNGLIPVLIQVFQHGLKSAGFFRKQIYAWDVITTACDILSGRSLAVKQEQSLYRSTLNNLGDFIRNTSPQRSITAPSQSSSGRNSPQFSARDEEGPVFSKTGPADVKAITNRLLFLHNIIKSQQERGLGKDDMFQVLVCVGLRERCLSEWLKSISSVIRQGTQLYERHAFMCNSQAILALASVLTNLSEYSITFEPILLRGLDELLSGR
ncbi:DENN domain-containing protein 5B-like [Styela clava]